MGKSNLHFNDNKRMNLISDVDPKDVGTLITTAIKIIRDFMKK